MLRQGSLLPERKDTRQYDSYTGLHQASQQQYRFVIPTQDPSTRSFVKLSRMLPCQHQGIKVAKEAMMRWTLP